MSTLKEIVIPAGFVRLESLEKFKSGDVMIGKIDGSMMPIPHHYLGARVRDGGTNFIYARIRSEPAEFVENGKPTKRTGGNDDPPPNEIISIYHARYPKSAKMDDWIYRKGIGFVHQAEMPRFQEEYAQCQVSGEWMKMGLMVRVENGMISKKEVKSGRYEICQKSGYAYISTEMRDVFNKVGEKERWHLSLIPDHAFQCDMDSRLYSSNCKIRVYNSDKYKYISYLSLTSSKKFLQCVSCSKVYPTATNVVQMRDDFGSNLCESCYTNMIAKDVIKAHNHVKYPRPIFTAPPKPRITKEALERTMKVMHELKHPLAEYDWEDSQLKKVMLFGIECETEFIEPGSMSGKRARLAMEAWQALGKDFCIIKHDGSLHGTRDPEPGEKIRRGGDYGFEIVTAPCDIATHRQRWPLLEKMPHYSHLRAWDVGTCGLHIHASRAPMTALQVCRITYMVNHPKMKKFIELVAGRCAARYNKFIPKKMADGTRPEMDKDKYTAINIKHEHTIEFRIFRGSVNWRRIIRCLEFVQAVIQFCHPGDRSMKELEDWSKFVKFAASHRKEWPEFNRWLDDQEEFNRLVLKRDGAWGENDNRTKAGEKPIPVDEAIDPDAPKKPKTSDKPKYTYATT